MFAVSIAGRKRAAVSRLRTPDFALSTFAHLPALGEAYTLDLGDRIRAFAFGHHLSNVYSIDSSGAVSITEGCTECAKKRFVRLIRRFGGAMSTVKLPVTTAERAVNILRDNFATLGAVSGLLVLLRSDSAFQAETKA